MQYLNQQIAALAKKKKTSLVRAQVSCGIFQEIDTSVLNKEEEKLQERNLTP